MLGGCGVTESWILDPGQAPLDHSMQVDIVVVKSQAALVAFAAINASDWFTKRSEVVDRWADDIQTISFDLKPGECGAVSTVPVTEAKSVLIYKKTGRKTKRQLALKS